ncbi:signal peptidase I [Rubrobacter marinus]|uniref:Signal peptidase I n=1 Tax=Rubrobacter marinus TaxID=2653852 RepID=A0A6G8PTJ7_9ACTN|nr:signal peptidase I [Rubrobacter marinus]QIN77286.1 signal peptidase I [Rubrobacter marinus]
MRSDERVWTEEPRRRKSRRELRQEREREKRKRGFLEYAVILVVAFALVFGVIKPFVVEAFRVPSESMVPTLEVQDRFLANKFVYRFTEPERGDIVVFESVEPNAEGEFDILVKRVVGLPGDTVQVQGGTLLVNGEPQNEPYLNTDVVPDINPPYGPREVPEGTFFALGDNRGNSQDSRFYGPVPMENLKGEAFLRFWPISRAEIL